YAAGNFKTLVLEVSRDPAMLRYLDNNTNRKEHPNENYARELMELFTMGIGNYTEADIKEAARAFTGWTMGLPRPGGPGMGFGGPGMGFGAPPNPATFLTAKPEFRFMPFFHDDGTKHFLGRS